MWLSKIKTWATMVVAAVFAALLVIISALRAKNARLDVEMQRRELARAKSAADMLLERAKRSQAASAEAAKARLEAEREIREGRRDYFDSDK